MEYYKSIRIILFIEADASIDDEDIDGYEKRGITFQAVHETRWQPPMNDDDDDYGVRWMERRSVEGGFPRGGEEEGCRVWPRGFRGLYGPLSIHCTII